MEFQNDITEISLHPKFNFLFSEVADLLSQVPLYFTKKRIPLKTPDSSTPLERWSTRKPQTREFISFCFWLRDEVATLSTCEIKTVMDINLLPWRSAARGMSGKNVV